MTLPLILSYGLVGLILVGLWRYRTRTDALLSFAVGGFLVGSAVAAASFGFRGLVEVGPWVVILWGGFYGFYLFALRRDDPEPVEDRAVHQQTLDGWADAGFTESMVFLLRPGSGYVIIAVRRPGEPTTAFLYHRRQAGHHESWSFCTPLGRGEGTLITTSGTSGLLDLGEIRQITTDVAVGWDMHQDGLAFLAEQGIDAGQQIGNGFDDFLLWTRSRDRKALWRFPIGFLAAFLRPIFHYGPLRTRRGARRQLGRFL